MNLNIMNKDVKDIIIIANFCRDFSKTDNGRFMYLCKELSKKHNVEIITSDFRHTAKKHKEPLVHDWPFTVTFIHEPGYKKNISIKRFFSHYEWGKEVKKYLEKRKKPDVIYCAIPSLTAPLEAGKYCEKNNVRFIIDIQDLWPEAFRMVFDIPIISDVVFAPFKHMADEIYKKADSICGVSEQYIERALSVNKKVTMGHAVFLGTSLKTFDENVEINKPVIRKAIDNEIWIGYCGSLSASYDIPCVISALKSIKEKEHKVPKFIIMGDGDRRKKFESEAKNAGIDCVFLGNLSYNQMCAQLAQCDIVVNPIVKGSAASIINKHGDYAASGCPVINTQDSLEYRKLVESYNMGFNCEGSVSEDVAKKISFFIDNADQIVKMGKNARKCAEEKFDRKTTYNELISVIEE